MKFNLTPFIVEVAMISKVYAFKPFVLFDLEKKTCKNKMLKFLSAIVGSFIDEEADHSRQ